MSIKKLLCTLLALALLVPEIAMAAGYVGGNGAYGVYLAEDGIHQAWYDATVTGSEAEYIVGVYGTYVYYQTPASNGVSTLLRQPLYLVSDEYALADGTMENVTVATGGFDQRAREPGVVSDSVYGKAVLDEGSGYVYYIDGYDRRILKMSAEYPTLGLQEVSLYTSQHQISQLRLTANGLAFLTDGGAYLYLPMLQRTVMINGNVFEQYTQNELLNGYEVLLQSDGTLLLRLDAANNVTLTINDSVQEFALYGGSVYYIRRTRWLTEIDRFDPVTRSSKALTRMLTSLMPQIVSAGEYLYIMDNDYVVYRLSPSSGKYAVYMKLASLYQDMDDMEPRLMGAGEELLVYDMPKTGDRSKLELVYNVFVGETEHPTLPTEPTATPTPTPIPTPIPTVYPTMQRGSRGENVRLLQQKLVELGYLNDTADGVFGAKTQTAVEQLQADLGLTVTGRVDDALMQRIMSGQVNDYDPYQELKRGDTGNRVTQLQMRLRELGYLAGAADGKFGNATYNAVLAFQKQKGFTQTGVADAETLRALYADDAPKNLSFIELKDGDSGYRVAELIDRLIELYYLPSSARGSIFNADVKQAVQSFQRQLGYWQSGTATQYLQTRLFSASAPEYDGYQTLRYGDNNYRVLQLQNRLKALGYQAGNTDGDYGTRTRSAVSAFQKQAGLSATGIADPETQTRLYAYDAPAYPTPTPVTTPTPRVTGAPFIDYGSGIDVAVNVGYAVIYDQPTTTATVLGTVARGIRLKLLASNGTWARVRNSGGYTGYTLMGNLAYITPTLAPTPTPTPAPTTEQFTPLFQDAAYRVRLSYTDLRSQPLDSAATLSRLYYGETVTVSALSPNWARATNARGVLGYVRRSAIEPAPVATPTPTLTPTPTPAQEQFTPLYRDTQYRVRVSYTELRSQPLSNASVLARLYYGETLTVSAISPSWARATSARGIYGYVPLSAIELAPSVTPTPTPTPTPKPTPTPEQFTPLYQAVPYRVRLSYADVYSQPQTNAPVRTRLYYNDRVSVSAISPSWAMVTTSSGLLGYMSLGAIEPAPEITPTPTPKPTPTPVPTATPIVFIDVTGEIYVGARQNNTPVYYSPDWTLWTYVSASERFRLEATGGEWYRIRHLTNGRIAFVLASQFRVLENPTPTPVPVVTPTPTPVPVITPTPTPVPVITPTPTPRPSSDYDPNWTYNPSAVFAFQEKLIEKGWTSKQQLAIWGEYGVLGRNCYAIIYQIQRQANDPEMIFVRDASGNYQQDGGRGKFYPIDERTYNYIMNELPHK